MSLGDAKHETGLTLGQHPDLYPYVLDHIAETKEQRELRDEIVKQEQSRMMGAPDEAQFLAWLVGLTGAKRVIEVGVFRGSTALAIALQLPADGKLIGLDVSADFAQVGMAAWAKAGVQDKIDLRVAPAAESMQKMVDAGEAGTYDLCFIDADKVGYDAYYEYALTLLKKNGVIAIDNVLWHGEVKKPETDDARAIVALVEKVKNDPRVHATMLPVADGVYMCRKL